MAFSRASLAISLRVTESLSLISPPYALLPPVSIAFHLLHSSSCYQQKLFDQLPTDGAKMLMLKSVRFLTDQILAPTFMLSAIARITGVKSPSFPLLDRKTMLMRDSGCPRSTTRVSARSTSPRPGSLLVKLLLQRFLHTQTGQSTPVVLPA
ncbi:hypothetical protein AB3S75_027335 [Citrus x aurantiifolia]